MKNLFPGYYRPTKDEVDTLWAKGTFVFDTSVLLNLYSYPEQAREDVLNLLKEVAPATWIPYQVMLEFHRNRYARINSGNGPLMKLETDILKMSRDVKGGFKAIDYERRNTGVRDLTQRLENFQVTCDSLIEALKVAKNRLPKPGLHDEIAAELATIYENKDKVGLPPKNQDELQSIFKEGEIRFAAKIPPGFADARTKDAVYRSGGLTYEARFGDLVVWKQLISHVKASELKHVVFITAERKDDWWLKGEGKDDILGPLPELVDEFVRETSVDFFWLYSIDEFLEESKNRTKKEISADTLDQVRIVDAEQEQIFNNPIISSGIEEDDNNKIYERFWISNRHRIGELFSSYLIENGASEVHQSGDDFEVVNILGHSCYKILYTIDIKKIEIEFKELKELWIPFDTNIPVILIGEHIWDRKTPAGKSVFRIKMSLFLRKFKFDEIWLMEAVNDRLRLIEVIRPPPSEK
ncbi:DUF4935 domain-containing protein [Duganella sp. FT134W]|uniref:DUF4935 domain-containing protein n=1 Tax=Duganella margarita TaxID=2692170 RepID=A0A7X4H3R8_9BURK|nr:PIN-like domain-containing protein [Duganella margarita]MYM74074.1 DUF4935 domain-containing protein [Duganella margarita]